MYRTYANLSFLLPFILPQLKMWEASMTHHSTKWVLFLASPTPLSPAHQFSHHSAEKNKKMQLLRNGVSMCLSYKALTPRVSPRPLLLSPPLPESCWGEMWLWPLLLAIQRPMSGPADFQSHLPHPTGAGNYRTTRWGASFDVGSRGQSKGTAQR